MTFLSPLIMVGLISLVVYLSQLNNDKVRNIAILDESGLFKSYFEDSDNLRYQLLEGDNLETAKAKVQAEGQYGLLYIPQIDNLDELSEKVTFYSEDSPSLVIMDDIEDAISAKANNMKLEQAGMDASLIRELRIRVDARQETFGGEETSKMGTGLKLIFGGLAGYLLFMFIIIYGNMIMRSVIEEKTSRIIEVIVSSVKPVKLLLGKIIGTSLAGVTQFVAWVILIGILSVLMTTVLGIDPTAMQQEQAMEQAQALGGSEKVMANVMLELSNLPIANLVIMFILFFIGGYLLYASLYAAIGSAVDSETDTQQFMLPILMPLILAVYVGFFTVIENPHGTVSQVFSYIPFTSPVVMLMRIPFGVPVWQQVLSVVILFATFLGTVWLAAKIYRVGILMYGKKASYKELFKWIKYS
jgi:ABC-2 type transport system permease protein